MGSIYPTFSCVPTFPFFFNMSYYPYIFFLKCHLRDKNVDFFLAWLSYFFSESRQLKTLNFEFLTHNNLCFASNIVTAIVLLKY